MDLTSPQTSSPVLAQNGVVSEPSFVSMVDPFLVEALQSPRHRLTILRMELDVQKFSQNPDAQQFEFPHFPTSYIRLAAHRVAQHYGLHTMNQENVVGGQEIRILVTKKPESKFPAVCLSDVPAKESENERNGQVKFFIRPRPKASSDGGNELGNKRNSVRSVEERKEAYDRARARIFGSPNGYETDESLTRVSSVERSVSMDESEISRNLGLDEDRSLYNRDIGNSSRGVAIFRDREKDRTDPDYDRSYDRYVRNIPNIQNFNLPPFSMQKFQHPQFVQYDSVFPQQVQMAAPPQASVDYMNPVMTTPYCAMGLNQISGNALYMQWPTQSMIYAQSYDQLRHGFIQAPFSQQPLSFDYSQSR